MARIRLTRRGALLTISLLGSAHFVLGITCVVLLMFTIPSATHSLIWFVLPYVGILLACITAYVLAAVRRVRASTIVVAIAILVSVAMCMYDFHNSRYQIGGGGTGQTYLIWWWYYEPWWYGYKPGNV